MMKNTENAKKRKKCLRKKILSKIYHHQLTKKRRILKKNKVTAFLHIIYYAKMKNTTTIQHIKKESTIKNAKIAEKSPLFYGVFSVYMIQQFPSDFSVAGTKETLFFEILRPHHYPLKKNLNF